MWGLPNLDESRVLVRRGSCRLRLCPRGRLLVGIHVAVHLGSGRPAVQPLLVILLLLLVVLLLAVLLLAVLLLVVLLLLAVLLLLLVGPIRKVLLLVELAGCISSLPSRRPF